MTPCEKFGYKVGDRFEVVSYNLKGIYHIGDILELIDDDDSQSPWFVNKSFKEKKVACNLDFLNPLKSQTEAEKRGAKFGTMGVIKATGQEWVFVRQVGSLWRGMSYSGVVIGGSPSDFRLDHEPEYKEIPFSEATHEQRMNVDNLVHVGGRKVEQIFRFNNDSYAFTCERDEVVYQSTSLVKVRVPS